MSSSFDSFDAWFSRVKSTILVKPESSFSFGWDSCCWVRLEADDGRSYSGGDIIQIFTMNDLENNSPSFKLPPLWLIMAGCSQQFIDLAPVDPDGDIVKCRWATEDEAGGAVLQPDKHPSLSLDENCVVWYDGTQDGSSDGVKPIALMMEDFDSEGNVRSSIPVQFLGQVWRPDMTARSHRYPSWFAEEGDHDDHEHTTLRSRRSEPTYCSEVPVFVEPTPDNDQVFDGQSGT